MTKAPLVLLFLCVGLLARELGSRALWASHEARAAQNAQRMLDDQSWLLPHLYDGQVELQKPAGFYWLVACVGWLLGEVNGWAVRLPATVAGSLLVFAVWWHLHQRRRPTAAFIAAGMLVSAVHFTGTARIGRIDVPLACAVGLCLLVGRGRLTWPRSLALGLGGSAALLLKGPIGLLLAVAALAVWWWREQLFRANLTRGVVALTLALLLAAPWYLWANHATQGEFFRTFFIYHHWQRAFGGAEALAGHPWWYYVPRFMADFLPWSPLLLWVHVQRRSLDRDAHFGATWFFVMFVGLSLSRFKRADYLIPTYAGAAIWLGCTVERWWHTRTVHRQRQSRRIFLTILAIIPCGWYLMDRLVTDVEQARRDDRPLAQELRILAPADEIILFRVESHLLAFHLGRPIRTVIEWHDLNTLLRQGQRYIILPASLLPELQQHCPFPLEALSLPTSSHRPLVVVHGSSVKISR